MKKFSRIEPTEVNVFGNKFKHYVVVKHFKTDDGFEHEFTTTGGEGARSVGTIALTADLKVITSYQFRPGPEKWMYELPGGGIHDGEDPQVAAERELLEESGYQPGEMQYVGACHRGGYNNLTYHYFFATNCQLSEDGPKRDDTENAQGLEVRLISIADLIKYAETDNVVDSAAVLMAYDKLKELEAQSGESH